MYSLEQSLNLICWYNGHTKTFLNLAEELKNYNEKKNFYWKHEWDTEEHFIWMLLVGMFGDWGTSINSGWIDYDKTNAAADYLFNLFKEDIEEGSFYKNENGIWEEYCIF